MILSPVLLRATFWLGMGVCLVSLAVAYLFMERYLLLEPCPLCILDRIVVGVMAMIFLALALLGPERRKTCLILLSVNGFVLGLGFLFAGRHIYLENRPLDDMPVNCLSGHAVAKGLVEIIEKAFDANADCGIISWEFLGLSISSQVLILFIGIAILLVTQLYSLVRMKHERLQA